MLVDGLYKKTDTSIWLYILPGVVSEYLTYHSVNSDPIYILPVEQIFLWVPAPGLLV